MGVWWEKLQTMSPLPFPPLIFKNISRATRGADAIVSSGSPAGLNANLPKKMNLQVNL